MFQVTSKSALRQQETKIIKMTRFILFHLTFIFFSGAKFMFSRCKKKFETLGLRIKKIEIFPFKTWKA